MFKTIIILCSLCNFVYAETIQANVTAVSTQGNAGAYRFSVTIESDETGCGQYANWWEVLSEEGELLYRRILVHSHPDTQPFTRSGGSINIKPDELVYVRAHMNKLGYVGSVMKGSVSKGFKVVTDFPKFPKKLETQSPLPKGCLY